MPSIRGKRLVEETVGEAEYQEAVQSRLCPHPEVFAPGEEVLTQASSVEAWVGDKDVLLVLLIIGTVDYDGEASEGDVEDL